MNKDELIQNLRFDLEVIEKEMGAKEMSVEDACRLVQAKRVTIKSLIELGAFNEY
jgi:hypothetical protein